MSRPLVFIPAPRPRDDTPSRFVSECLPHLPNRPGVGIAADLGAGYGRHTRLLAKLGFKVLAFDLNVASLAAIARQPSSSAGSAVLPVMADLAAGLPVREASLDLVIGVHFKLDHLLPRVAFALKAGGMLLYETPANQGRNWRSLPKMGQLKTSLEAGYELLIYRERPAGPAGTDASVVNLLARKRSAPNDQLVS